MKTYIIGHTKPDLDSVVASISFSIFATNMGYPNPTPAICDTINPETEFVLKKFDTPAPILISQSDITPEDRVILVDHNEEDQRLSGLDPSQIVAIFDHHKINTNLSNPILIQIFPYGSSNTICHTLLRQNGIIPDQSTASLMLSAILSDTVGLKSSTTTEADRSAVTILSEISQIADIDSLTLEIFRAKSDISKLTDQEVILNDHKVFDFNGKKTLIGQIETVEQEQLITNRKFNLISSLQSIKQAQNLDFAYLAITDILKLNTKLLVSGEQESQIATTGFDSPQLDGVINIGNRLSRKKDIAPVLENATK
jgi:manganese-dependent inorganic pyrophosphatase